MIVQVQGNVKFPITLDPTVWIFDDRKIEWKDAFQSEENGDHESDQQDIWSQNEYQQKIQPPVNKSLTRYDRKKVLENTYVMPVHHFLKNAETNISAGKARLHGEGQEQEISIDQLENAYLLFAVEGKPLKETGPVHVLFQDGSNKENPITHVSKITIV
ncbi:hypothetical protein [Halalkalibacillus halophilus]|uniref:hypothetical protein n=1 Tax=Halalkalibacillus halophilus TaxID=392827 RepID=UPI00040F0E08|nr:hypothetical protein [Halalkalibacillus halophilus]